MQCLESSSMISPAPMVREAVGARSLLTDERRDNPKSFLPSQRYPHSRSVRSAVTEGCSRVFCFRLWHMVTFPMSVVLALLFSCMALGYIFYVTSRIAVYVWHMFACVCVPTCVHAWSGFLHMCSACLPICVPTKLAYLCS